MKYSHHESPEIEVPSEVNEIIPLTLEDEDKIKSALLALYYQSTMKNMMRTQNPLNIHGTMHIGQSLKSL